MRDATSAVSTRDRCGLQTAPRRLPAVRRACRPRPFPPDAPWSVPGPQLRGLPFGRLGLQKGGSHAPAAGPASSLPPPALREGDQGGGCLAGRKVPGLLANGRRSLAHPQPRTLLPRRGRRGKAFPLPLCGRGIEGEGDWPGTSRRLARLVPRLRAATLAESGLISGAPSTPNPPPSAREEGETLPLPRCGRGIKGEGTWPGAKFLGRWSTDGLAWPTLHPNPPPSAREEGDRGGGQKTLWWAERPISSFWQSTGTLAGLSCSCGGGCKPSCSL